MTFIARYTLQDKVVEFYWDPVAPAGVNAVEMMLTKVFVFGIGGRGMTEAMLYGPIATAILARYLQLKADTPNSPKQFLDDVSELPRQDPAALIEAVIPLLHKAWKPPKVVTP